MPQPSDSPSDPLNWPLWKKDLALLIMSTNNAAIEAWAFMLLPGYGVIADQFHIGFISNWLSNSRTTTLSTDNSASGF